MALEGSSGGSSPAKKPQMTSDPRFQSFVSTKTVPLASNPLVRKLAAPPSQQKVMIGPGLSYQPQENTLISQPYKNRPVKIDLPILRKEWLKPSPANPFGEPEGKTDTRQDVLMPAVTPQIRAMARPNADFFDTDIVTPDYIKRVAQQDNDLAQRLAGNYLNEYSRRMAGGYINKPMADQDVDALTKLSQRSNADDFINGVGSLLGGAFKTLENITRAPVRGGAFKTLEVGFEQQPKTVDPRTLTPDTLGTVQIANVDTFKLPKYYRDQIEKESSPVEALLYPGQAALPDPDPARDKTYQAVVNQVLQQRRDWDYYSDFATAADGINTLASAPGVRTAYYTGQRAEANQQNFLGTGNIAGLTSFARVTQFVKTLKDNGIVIDEEDRQALRNGWSADTVNKYGARLAENGKNLSDIVLSQGMTWPELKRALDLARFPAENQADIARSLGFKVSDEGQQPIYVTNYSDYGETTEEVGKEFQFKVDNPDQVVTLDDLRTKADAGWIGGDALAALVGQKYTYAYLADVKTVPFQDLAASIAFDPTNYGKLQLVWKPLGLVFEGGAKLAKFLGKGVYYGAAGMGDVGVGALKTVGNLIGKAKGVESEILKPGDWNKVSQAAHYLVSETAQSTSNKIANRAFFVTKSILSPEYARDGEKTLQWIDQVLPRLQEAARSGDWTPFVREVPVGAGDYAAQGLNAVGQDLIRIAADEDAFGRFADSVLKPFAKGVEKITAEDAAELRQIAQDGDYAKLLRLISEKTIDNRLESGLAIDEARQAFSASDLINHATSAYRGGVQVLAEKELGVFGHEIASPRVRAFNDMMSMLARQWTNAVLTARPGWNVINYIDNNARLLANGFNPSADVQDYEKTLLSMGVTPTQMREIIYGGNFLDEAMRLNIPVTPEMANAAEFAKRITVDSDANQLAQLVERATRARESIKELPEEARRSMEDVVGRLRVEADKLAKGQGSVSDLRAAADRVTNLSNQLYGKSATIDTQLFKTRLQTMREYMTILRSGDGKAISRIWNNWVELGHALHRDIEASARMRVFAPTFIDKYHDALESVARDLPQLPNEQQLAERFVHITSEPERAEAVREAALAYSALNARLRGIFNEAAMNPSKLPDLQASIDEMLQEPLSAARNFIYSTQPLVGGMTPAADTLMQKMGDWLTGAFDGMSYADLNNRQRVTEALDRAFQRAETRLKVEGAEANMMARTNQIVQPTGRVPNSAVNWMQDGQITDPHDIGITVDRMRRMQTDVEAINQQLRDSYVELNHEPYLNALDQTYQRVPNRLHRYDIMRDSFAERFAGEAQYGDETVQVVRGTSVKGKTGSTPMAVLADGRSVPLDDIKITDPQRAWYFDRYARWEKTKPAGNDILTRSGIATETGTGAKMRKPPYVRTGAVEAVPPDVARSYTRRMEDDLLARGGQLPTEYVEKLPDGTSVTHQLAYETPDEFVQRFASPGSGLGFYKPSGGGANLIEGIQATADRWTYLARLRDSTNLEDFADVYIGGKKVSESYKTVVDAKAAVFGSKGKKVTVMYTPAEGVKAVPLTNDPKLGETLMDVTRRRWTEKIEGVHVETRGQWIPVFDPNAPRGQRVTFQKIGADDAIESLRVPVETGTAIPDEMGEQLLHVQEVTEPVEQIGIQVEASLHRLDNLLSAAPEPAPFKPDFTFNGADVMSSDQMRRLPEGGYGLEIRTADGRTQTVPVSQLTPKPVEGALNANVAGTPEQLAAEAGLKTAGQQATIEATDPIRAFLEKHPRIQSREDLLARGAALRDLGVPITDDMLNDMADLYEAASQHMFKSDDPDFVLKHLNLTAVAPTEGLYSKAEANVRTGWLTDEERQQVYDAAIKKGKPQAEAMAEAARGYPAAQGLVDSNGVPLFAQGPQGEVLGAYKYLFGGKPGEGFGMIHLLPGAEPGQLADTTLEEFAHHMFSMAELADDVLPGPEMAGLRNELRKQLDVISDAVGAPKLLYASERGPKASRRVLYQQLYKVDRVASNLEDPAKWAAFEAEARAASERAAEYWKTYIKTGQAPTKELKGVFQRFKQWLTGVFQARWNRGEQIPVEVKQVFDQWLTDNPEWKEQLTRKGQNFFKNNEPAIQEAAKTAGLLDDWEAAVEKLQVAYGGWNDSPAIQKFHETAKRATAKLREYAKTGDKSIANTVEEFEFTPAGERLGEIIDEIDNAQSIVADIQSGKWRPRVKSKSISLKSEESMLESLAPPKPIRVTQELKDNTILEKKQEVASLIEEARGLGVKIDDENKAVDAIMKFFDEMTQAGKATEKAAAKIPDILQPVWDAYAELLQDGKFYPKTLVNGEWVYPDGGGPLTIPGRLTRGHPTPPKGELQGYLTSQGKTIDEILASERGTPATLDELAALNAPNATYVSPALLDIMKYHAGVKTYLDQWHSEALAALDGGFLPGSTVRGLLPEDVAASQQWLNDKYAQVTRAASTAQALAEEQTKRVMMDFETTYNLDRLMQQGPSLPSWTGKLAGAQPLRIGGIVPFFKFPRENVESWINTLGSHPALLHNLPKYQTEANIERQRFGLPEQALPVWPVQVGDKVVTLSPFAFISLSNLIRPFSPYVDEDATGVDQAISVAGQMGLSLGPSLRLGLNILGLSEQSTTPIPQLQALVPPSAYPYISESLQQVFGLKSKADEFYIDRQMVYDALADLNAVQSEGAKKQILADLEAAINSADHPRKMAATDHYYTMRFQSSGTGYWTGLYPKEISPGELDLRQYNTDLAQLRSAMAGAGLSPDQIDRIEGYIAGDPRSEAKRHLTALYNADPAKAVSGTESEAWAKSVSYAGRRSEYYTQRAMIEAEYQQKYGFSGTQMNDADREKYNIELGKLNAKYEDVLQPKKVARQPWQTEEDYQRNVSGLWLEYLNETRPQYTQFKTYAEYQTAVDQWEKDLPKTSVKLWGSLQGVFGQFGTRNATALPGYLDAVSNKQAMDKFTSQYDTVSEAIYKTLRDKYYSGYWDSVNGKFGPERLLAELEYKQKRPVPGEAEVQKWIGEGLYQQRFSAQEIIRELRAHPTADIEQSILSGKTLPERQAFEIGELLARIPPGNAYFDFLDTLPKDIQKHLQTYQDSSYTANESPTKWEATYTALRKALTGQFPEPTLNMAREWTNAVHENEAMELLRNRMFPGIKSKLDEYSQVDRGDAVARRQFRQQNPQIGQYYDWLYNEWQTGHPLWNKYYGNGETNTTTQPKSTAYVSGKGGKTYVARSSGGRRYKSYSGGGGSYYSTPTVSGASPLLEKQWQGFRDMVNGPLYDAVVNHLDNGGPLTNEETSLLQAAFKQYPFGATDFNDWLENVLPKMRSAMIPGTSIFASNNYDRVQNQPQTQFGYNWFGKGKNAM